MTNREIQETFGISLRTLQDWQNDEDWRGLLYNFLKMSDIKSIENQHKLNLAKISLENYILNKNNKK